MGVSGHPLTEPAYLGVPFSRQLNLVKELGATWYRIDLPPTRFQFDRMDRLVAMARRRGVTILPILFSPITYEDKKDPEEVRKVARDYAFRVVSRYRSEIKYWALDNETDGDSILQPGEAAGEGHGAKDLDGDKPEHYHQGRYEWARAALMGLGEGVRAADPEAKRIVNSAGWLHYGFIERIVNDDVPFEIIAWHWYSEMGDITDVGDKHFNLLSHLEDFGKPIWITEGNRREGGPPGEEEEQAEYLAGAIRGMASLYPRVRGYFVYELLDEPNFGPDSVESHYGLYRMKKKGRNQWAVDKPKRAFEAVAATARKIGDKCEQ